MMKIADHIINAEPVHSGSTIYKARRRGGGYVAVQIFPFQLSEKQYQFFEGQVGQLIKAFEEYSAAVPRILNHGLTKTGLPFIEMEWIEGESIDELIKGPDNFSIEEISKAAEQVSSVLTYCHNLGLLHGNISGSNIIWHSWRKRYVLTGFRFGLKESSLRKENFVPASTKNEYKNEVRDFGKLMLQLIRSSTAEGSKEKAIPPDWMISLVEKCITNNHESFRHAGEAYDYILQHYKAPLQKDWYRSKPQQPGSAKMSKEKTAFANLSVFTLPKRFKNQFQGMRFVLNREIVIGLIIAALLAGFSIFAQKRAKGARGPFDEISANSGTIQVSGDRYTTKEKDTAYNPGRTAEAQLNHLPAGEPTNASMVKKPVSTVNDDSDIAKEKLSTNNQPSGSYKVRSRAHFYDQPNESTKRNAFITHWDNAILHPLKEEKGFIYIVFTNEEGQTSRGWLRKKDLVKL